MPVRCAVWHHWIFVNMDGNAPPIEQHVASMVELMDGYDIAATRAGHREDWPFDANWKLQNDNWETYHHVWVHKGIFNKISDDLDLKTGIPKMDTVQAKNLVTLQRRNDGKRDDFRPGGNLLPLVPDKRDADRSGSTSIIFPNVTVTLAPNHIASVITDPLAPDRTMAKLGFFFVGEAASAKNARAGREKVLDLWLGKTRSVTGRDGIRSQDFGIWEVQQIARQSPVADEVVFSPVWERNIHYFHNQVLDTLGA